MKRIFTLLTAVVLFMMQNISFGQAPSLGTTSDFALFTAVGAFTNDGESVVTGDVGTNVGAFTAFPPGTLVGDKHVADGVSATAAADVAVAYAFLAALTPLDVIPVGLGGQILGPGVHSIGAAATLTGVLTLDGGGNPDALFIIKINGALGTAANSTVSLINSANVCNVYWQINGQVDLETNSVFVGTIIAAGPINLFVGSTLSGRGLSTEGAISLHTTAVTVPVCACTVAAPTVGTITQADCFTATGSVVLSGLPAGDWTINPGAIAGTGASTTISGLTEGTYNYTVTSGLCISPESEDVVIFAQPLAVGTPVFTQGNSEVCQDATNNSADVTYTATAENSTSITYSVLPVEAGIINSTSGVIDWDAAFSGTATITATATGLCGPTSMDKVVTVKPLPEAPTVIVTQPTEAGGTGTITITAPTGDWMGYSIDCITYTNYTGVFSGLVPGSYNVTDKIWNGCISTITIATVNDFTTDIEKIGVDSYFDVYPVPNNGHFTVEINAPAETSFDILISNVIGTRIYEEKNIRVSGKLEHSIDISQVPRGIYYILFRSGNDKAIRKVLKSE